MKSRYRLFISIVLTVATSYFALSYYSSPFVKPKETEGHFSACKVADDIKIISAEPHSIEHTVARSKVKDFLVKRLDQMGVPPTIFTYDSIPVKLGLTIQLNNLYASIDPIRGKAQSYLLLVAHMDSRFRKMVLDKSVYSFGAADDGYGLGVILEIVRVAIGYRADWSQGIKILFTDSEESDLEGMRCALKNDPFIFENVGLVINIEARGVKGPALLFETSKGNDKILKLYKNAKNPVTYSLTSVVYNTLPNSTDYSLLKDSLPGMNFSVIDNLNYYHTDLDNFSNISLSSIQHYGEQIMPVIHKYLTSSIYSNSKSLKSDDESVCFSMPIFGLVIFSSIGYRIFNLLVFILFLTTCMILVNRRKMAILSVLRSTLDIFFFALIFSIIGLFIATLGAALTKQKYSMVNLPYINYEWYILIGCAALLITVYTIYYIRGTNKKRFNSLESLMGNVTIQILLSIILYLVVGENFFVLIPVFLSLIATLAWIITGCRLPFIIVHSLIILLLLPFYYALSVSLTIGFLPFIMIFSTLFVSLLIPLADCYDRKLF